jgi:hypothetical protein
MSVALTEALIALVPVAILVTGTPRKKAPGDRWSPGASNFLKPNDFQRAGDRTRTGDVQLGKLAFYQLNYARKPYGTMRYNRRPTSTSTAPTTPSAPQRIPVGGSIALR